MSADLDKIRRIKECIFILYSKVQKRENIGRLEYSRLNTFYIPSARGLSEEFFDKICELIGDNLYYIDTVEETSTLRSKLVFEKFFFSLLSAIQAEKDMHFGKIPGRFRLLKRIQGLNDKKIEREWSGHLFEETNYLAKILSCGFVIRKQKVIDMMLTYFKASEILRNFPICLHLQQSLIVQKSVESFFSN